MSDYDGFDCPICGVHDPNQDHEVYSTPCTKVLAALADEMKGELDKLTQELYDSKYIVASRKELLEEVKQLLDVIYAEDIVSSGDLGKVYEKVAKELGDD